MPRHLGHDDAQLHVREVDAETDARAETKRLRGVFRVRSEDGVVKCVCGG